MASDGFIYSPAIPGWCLLANTHCHAHPQMLQLLVPQTPVHIHTPHPRKQAEMEFNRRRDGWCSAGAGHGQGTALLCLHVWPLFFVLHLCFPMLLLLQTICIPPFSIPLVLPLEIYQGFCQDACSLHPAVCPTPTGSDTSPDCKVLSSWSTVLGATLGPWGWGFLGSRWISGGVIGVLPPALLPLCSFICAYLWRASVVSQAAAQQGVTWAPSPATDSLYFFLGVQMSFYHIRYHNTCQIWDEAQRNLILKNGTSVEKPC